MSPVPVLAEAAELARSAGYEIREDHLDGAGGGHCVIHGNKVLLLDVTQSLEEQLSDVCDALRSETQVWQHSASPALARMLGLSEAA